MHSPLHWQARLPHIRAEPARLDSPTLDRGMIEQLFSVSCRLMAPFGNLRRQGQVLLVQRARLVEMLDSLLATRPMQAEITRKRELPDKLAALEREARHEARAWRTILTTPPWIDPGLSWPQGITLEALGTLSLRFSTPDELLGCVLALDEDAASDDAGFVARLAQTPVEGREGPDYRRPLPLLAPFRGPLDLLLALVRRNQYPLDALPIVEITRQYDAYLREAADADMELGLAALGLGRGASTEAWFEEPVAPEARVTLLLALLD